MPLVYMVVDERRNRRWQDYTATALWMLGRTIGGNGWVLEPYIEFAYPNKTKKDKRTPTQIKEDILRRLTS